MTENLPFLDFWEEYPRKVSKPAAERAFTRALGQGVSPSEIMAGLVRWKRNHADTPEQFIPHAATWLNNRRWEDPDPEPTITPLQREMMVGGHDPSRTPEIAASAPTGRERWPRECLGADCPCNGWPR